MYEEKNPNTRFEYDVKTIMFFRELAKARKGTTIKLNLDRTFPLYSEDGVYKIAELEKFYYNRAKDTAFKFD